jgi:hypothetical protein
MTREAAEKVSLAVLTAVLTAIVVPLVMGAVTPKVSRADFTAHIRETEAKVDSVNLKVQHVDARLERVLDVVCTNRQQHRSCGSTGIPR